MIKNPYNKNTEPASYQWFEEVKRQQILKSMDDSKLKQNKTAIITSDYTLHVKVDEFILNGGKLIEGRIIYKSDYDPLYTPIGKFISYDVDGKLIIQSNKEEDKFLKIDQNMVYV